MKLSFIVASNNEIVLQSSLLASPDLRQQEIVVIRGARSASQAYNEGLSRCSGDVAIFIHQDVYLPHGWIDVLTRNLGRLCAEDSRWAVGGVFGINSDGNGVGHLHSTGLKRRVGSPFDAPATVRTLDEVVIILRKGSNLRFDDSLPGFHLYGADICLSARASGWNCYALDAFCLHNTNGIGVLGRDYWRAWLYMRRKWKHVLPIHTPCMTISRFGLPALKYISTRPLWIARNRDALGKRVQDPKPFYEGLRRADTMSAA